MVFICYIQQGNAFIRVTCVTEGETLDISIIKNFIESNKDIILDELKPEKYKTVEQLFEIGDKEYLLRFKVI